MFQTLRTTPWRYGVVPLAVAPALLIRWLLLPYLGGELPLLMLWPAVVFCGWFGGLYAGLLGTALAALAIIYLSVGPPHWFALSRPADWVGLALFILLGSVTSLLIELVSRARRRAEEQRNWLRTTLECIGEGVIATDAQARVVFVNEVARQLTGWGAADALGQPLERVLRLVDETTHQPADNPIVKALRTNSVVELTNHAALLTPTGAEVPVDDSAAPLRGDAGEVRGAVLVFRDVSERRRYEHELQRRAEESADAVRHKDEFLSVLAHELRNPLAPIRNAVNILRLGGPPDQEQWARELIARQVQHIERLVEDILDASRAQTGKLRLQKQPLELVPVIANAIEMSSPLIEARKQQLAIALPPEPLRLEADPIRLAQIVSNLLNNAAKYTEERGHVWLSAARDGAHIIITVKDDGIGIAPDLLPHVFELFAQGKRALDRSRGGLGIGLSLVKHLVEMHRGSITAHSDGPGKGSTFTVRLPALSA